MRRLLLIGVAVLLLSVTLCAQLFGGKKDDTSAPRNLTGDIFDKEDHVVPNAIVYLKNTRTLAVITFITGNDGSYRFNNLSPNIDYEVRAEANGRIGSSPGKVANSSRRASSSASHPVHRKREAPLTSVPRSSSSRTRASFLPVMPSIFSTRSRNGRS